MLNSDLQIQRFIDSTNLKANASYEEIDSLCKTAAMYQFAAVCINPFYVQYAAEFLFGTNVNICSVVGFPLGANIFKNKILETEYLLKNKCNEIDMVINISQLMNKNYDYVQKEIEQIANLCHSENAITKVIIETCLLSESQKIDMCKIVSQSGADYIKTSTGFSLSGATKEDIRLFRNYLDKSVKIKAAGGIKDLKSTLEFIKLGAKRIGTSNGKNIIDELIKEAE